MRELLAGDPAVLDDDLLIGGDNLAAMAALPDGAFDVVYMDPPFNTGRRQRRRTVRAQRAPEGEGTVGFGGHRYRSQLLRALAYDDEFEDYLGFLAPRLGEVIRLLSDAGTLYFHIDYREAHYCKLLLDELFGRECFLNEIIWAYDYGGRPKRRWPAKHDTILVYVKDPERYHFDSAEVEREPYMAPGLVTAQKRALGKRPTDTWWHTIVPTSSHEKTGYPTQKPEGIVRRMVAASSLRGGCCLDPFAGSGTLGAACRTLGRRFVLVDSNPEALEVMRARLADQ